MEFNSFPQRCAPPAFPETFSGSAFHDKTCRHFGMFFSRRTHYMERNKLRKKKMRKVKITMKIKKKINYKNFIKKHIIFQKKENISANN